MCNFVIYFPDIMKQLLVRNPTFDTNVKWGIEFVVAAKLIKDEKLFKPFNLVKSLLPIFYRRKAIKPSNFHKQNLYMLYFSGTTRT